MVDCWGNWSSLVSGPQGAVCLTPRDAAGGWGSGCGLGFWPLLFGEQTSLIGI
jgi:hypothetical protein